MSVMTNSPTIEMATEFLSPKNTPVLIVWNIIMLLTGAMAEPLVLNIVAVLSSFEVVMDSIGSVCTSVKANSSVFDTSALDSVPMKSALDSSTVVLDLIVVPSFVMK